jgi:hypothetical protein
LSGTDTEALKAAATDDQELARAIIEAHQLQQAMDAVQIERAPVNLRKRLNSIHANSGPNPDSGFFSLVGPWRLRLSHWRLSLSI